MYPAPLRVGLQKQSLRRQAFSFRVNLTDLISFYPLPITHYLLPITHYPLPITNYLLPITHYPLPITNYPLPITNYPLPITHYPLPITHYLLPITQSPAFIFGEERKELGANCDALIHQQNYVLETQ